ncbi:MAG TPA: cytidine deaminase [Kofleriaceae bacterium]
MSIEDAAKAIQPFAHAPYSKFKVGAAVEMDGVIYTGVNVENASYPLSVCAERNAIAAAVAATPPDRRRITEVAVYTNGSPPASPCGGCRQVLREFAPEPDAVTIFSNNDRGEKRVWSLEQLLPDSFSADELP